jgi:hypothetical protein
MKKQRKRNEDNAEKNVRRESTKKALSPRKKKVEEEEIKKIQGGYAEINPETGKITYGGIGTDIEGVTSRPNGPQADANDTTPEVWYGIR